MKIKDILGSKEKIRTAYLNATERLVEDEEVRAQTIGRTKVMALAGLAVFSSLGLCVTAASVQPMLKAFPMPWVWAFLVGGAVQLMAIAGSHMVGNAIAMQDKNRRADAWLMFGGSVLAIFGISILRTLRLIGRTDVSSALIMSLVLATVEAFCIGLGFWVSRLSVSKRAADENVIEFEALKNLVDSQVGQEPEQMKWKAAANRNKARAAKRAKRMLEAEMATYRADRIQEYDPDYDVVAEDPRDRDAAFAGEEVNAERNGKPQARVV